MKKIINRSLMILVLLGVTFNTLACTKRILSEGLSAEDAPLTKNIVTINQTEADTTADTDKTLVYQPSKTLEENIEVLNKELEQKYGKRFQISREDDYEKAGKSDWTLVVDGSKVGIDTSTWKSDCQPGSEDSKYMEALLSAFTFFCKEEMGNSLWQLVTYKNGKEAAYELGKNGSTMYLWLTPAVS